VEQSSKLDENPRATHYGPPAIKILNGAGIGDELRSKGLLVDTVAWRRLDGSYIAGLNHATEKDSPDRMVALPLNEVAQLLKDHGAKSPSLSYLFNHSVISIGQDESKAWINALDKTTEKEVLLEADYIVGCDGANSIIRRSLFGDMGFPGRTWDEQIVATNVSLFITWVYILLYCKLINHQRYTMTLRSSTTAIRTSS
jgi:2-polyprenyl-6-methoxyphenol hydroxylase-like FAD-dependent oxidoreductase